MKIICAEVPYALLVCVVEGLSFERRKRAWEPPASQMMKRGKGKRSWTSSCFDGFVRFLLRGEERWWC